MASKLLTLVVQISVVAAFCSTLSRASAADESGLAEVEEYVERLIELGRAGDAYVVYEVITKALSRAGKSKKLRIACESAQSWFEFGEPAEPGSMAWVCPDPAVHGPDGKAQFVSRPAKLLAAGIRTESTGEGVVVIRFDVNTDGRVQNAEMVRATSVTLVDTALSYVRSALFSPALTEGVPSVDQGRELTIRFVDEE